MLFKFFNFESKHLLKILNGTDTALSELEEAVRGFLNREDVAILLIVQYVADMVRHIIENYTKLTPAILEIPSKEHAYDPSKDFILKRAQVILALCLVYS